jgi:dolichol-phosphate mannosyltransferase
MQHAAREEPAVPDYLPAPSVVVVLPTYTEADNIPRVVERLMACERPVDVLVVDDSSPDGTALVAAQLGRDYPGRVFLIVRDGQRGLAPAYQDGFAWAARHGYERIVQMDADGSHPAGRLPAVLAAIEEGGADLAIGSRYVPGGATQNWPLRRRVLSLCANLYARRALGLHQRDLTGAFRAWRTESLLATGPDRLSVNGFSFLVEMALRAHSSGLRVVEVPITFTDREHGTSKMSTGMALEGLVAVWRLRSAGRRTPVARPATLPAA